MPPLETLPRDVLPLLPALLTGFDLLRLSHVSRLFFHELLAPTSDVWKARLPVHANANDTNTNDANTMSWKQRYCTSASLRFLGATAGRGREAAIDMSLHFTVEDWMSASFSLEFWFALLPSGDDGAFVGGVLLGAQSEDWQDEWTPDTCAQFVHVDRNAQLYCSMTDRNPVVACKLELARWYHLVLTMKNSDQGDGNFVGTQCVYLDGEQVDWSEGQVQAEDLHYTQLGTGYAGGISVGKPTADFIGWYDFNGVVDTCRLYENCLSADAIESLKRGGPGPKSVWELNIENETMRGSAEPVRCTRPVERICSDVRPISPFTNS